MSQDSITDQPHLLLAAIVDSSEDAIISKSLQGIITSWNQGAQRIFGYSAEEAVGRSILMLLPQDRLEEEPKILDRIKRGERIEHFETVRRTKEGKLLNVSLTVSPVKDAAGTIIGASKIVRDITEQLDVLKRLRHSEDRFRITLASIGDAVIAADKVGQITFMNPVAESLTGWNETEALGLPLKTVFKIIDEITRQPVEPPVFKVLQANVVVDLASHCLLVSRDGTERPIDDNAAPIHEPNGEISGVVLVFRDVSERRKADLAAQRLAAIVHSSDDAIISKNLSGIIITWNEGAKRLFGYSEEEIIGKSVLTLIPPELQREEPLIIAKLQRGERIEHFETVRLAKNGRSIQVSLSVSPIKDGEGRVIGASKIVRNISERKQIEQALVDAQVQLQRHATDLEERVEERTVTLRKMVDELQAFSYSLSHDLRAPLRAVQSYLQMLLEDNGEQLDASGKATVQKVISSAQRMDRMVLELLNFTRLSYEPMTIEPVDVEELIRGIMAERLELQPARVDITIASPLPKVLGNEASLTQCITNLLDNGVKFVASGIKPEIRISSENSDGSVRLSFKDNGIGIDEDAQKQLFQMFHRAHGSGYAGTGIGLAIVRRAVERMGGSVGIESKPEQGSCFWLQLPGAPS